VKRLAALAGLFALIAMEVDLAPDTHPAAPHALPSFITEPGETDVLLVIMGLFLLAAVLTVGLIFLRLHTLPERMAHRSQKMQFEIVAVLGLLALFTHIHLFWVAGLILAMIDVPDFGTPLRRIAGSAEKLAGLSPGAGDTQQDERPDTLDGHRG
jgi:hypothetical protein